MLVCGSTLRDIPQKNMVLPERPQRLPTQVDGKIGMASSVSSHQPQPQLRASLWLLIPHGYVLIWIFYLALYIEGLLKCRVFGSVCFEDYFRNRRGAALFRTCAQFRPYQGGTKWRGGSSASSVFPPLSSLRPVWKPGAGPNGMVWYCNKKLFLEGMVGRRFGVGTPNRLIGIMGVINGIRLSTVALEFRGRPIKPQNFYSVLCSGTEKTFLEWFVCFGKISKSNGFFLLRKNNHFFSSLGFRPP